MKKIYKARQGATFDDSEAQIIGETITKLKVITPENIVNEAKAKSSPIHKFFEWDNSKAAEQYRLQQARDLTNHIIITIETNNEQIETKAFHSVSENGKRFYVTSVEAISNDDYRLQLLKQMIKTMEGLLEQMKLFKSL